MMCDCEGFENYTCLQCEAKENWHLVPEPVKLLLVSLKYCIDSGDDVEAIDILKRITVEENTLKRSFDITDIPLEGTF